MKCPRCVQRIHRAAAVCPHCGFSLADADAMFGDGEVKLRSLTDAAGIFRRSEREQVEDMLARIGVRFPQMFAAVYTGSLGETGNLRQFGFWLLNRGVFEDVPVEKPNEAGILIVIDPDSKAAGMSFGYLLDPFFEEEDTFDCLSRAHSYWLEGRYAEGLVKSLLRLEKLLRKRCQLAKRDPEKYERKVAMPVAVEDLVKKIRRGKPSAAIPVEQEVER
ncbi:MAG: TPM domain-containing protein [Armatimonadetes bacterium]|nr:TPM domain-containing protein [Akkermansiaceae bacterium]